MMARKKIIFDLVATLVSALLTGKETLEQLEYTLSANPKLYEKVKTQYEIHLKLSGVAE